MSSAAPAMAHRTFTVVTIALDKNVVPVLREALGALSGFEIAGQLTSYITGPKQQSVLRDLQLRTPDICIVDFDADRHMAAHTVEAIRDAMPGTAIYAMSAESSPDAIIEAMRAGCSEYLLKPVVKDRFVEALVKIEHKRRERGPEKRGRIYSFIGAKGGSGVTTIASHLATYVAQRGAKVLLIDQHADLGDVSVYLGLGTHQYNFYELVNNIHRLDLQLLEGFVVHHSSGVDVLPAPESFGDVVHASAAAVQSTLNFLRDIYEVIMIDCAPGLNGTNAVVIDESDVVYLVGEQELPSIKNLARFLEYLRRFCPENKIRVVLNRFAKKAPITQEQFEKAIRMPASVVIPNSYPDVISAIHSGSPIGPNSRSELAPSFKHWASTLTESIATSEHVEPKRRSAILGIF